MTGYATYCKDELGKKVDMHPIKYVLYDSNKKITKPVDKDKSKHEEYTEAIRDLRTSWLAKMGNTIHHLYVRNTDDNYVYLDSLDVTESIYEELLKEFPDHLSIYTSYLQSLDPMEHKRQLPILQDSVVVKVETSNETTDISDGAVKSKIIQVCDTALENIDQDGVLTFFAMKTDARSDTAKMKRFIKSLL